MRIVPILLGLSSAVVLASEAPQSIPVIPLAAEPVVDGKLTDWGTGGWIKVPVKPAVATADRVRFGLNAEEKNVTGSLTVQLKAGIYQDRLFLALRWPDPTADTEYKGWEWQGSKYIESSKRDDMAAIRFHLGGDFDRSMLAGKTYKVDVWLWSAARTNPAGLAEDWTHQISGQPIEDAAEFEIPGSGIVYIKKNRDGGSPIYRPLRPPRTQGASRLPSFEMTGSAAGSIADVAARGAWKGGYWNLEFSRRLNTGNGDDAVFKPGQRLLGQIAIFNRADDENKSVSEPLSFDFSALR
ncbi:ethylbenzene dehydrogenase-related protein [Denitratisoma oestradiolicum]|uniref:Ethylbenzene dehydrogenase n=1 Tax=Denitratisoma oestradiolicum TaxID=311182 RepID=A0A6S6XRQ5_9PROT|nr:ethylbenzene dehydrogenase-related protein [Denitratisoma oestradiolicum]CAB1367405.1 Ethylbenzene dehydrogenase [Denitratisoma oestradiolicum]